MPSDRVNEYLKSVCAEVRWRQAHDAVREELAAHIEDQTEAYMRSGMERETAERKASKKYIPATSCMPTPLSDISM